MVVFTINGLAHSPHEIPPPNSVVATLKEILKKNPDLKRFQVAKTGEGLKTRYTVIPL